MKTKVKLLLLPLVVLLLLAAAVLGVVLGIGIVQENKIEPPVSPETETETAPAQATEKPPTVIYLRVWKGLTPYEREQRKRDFGDLGGFGGDLGPGVFGDLGPPLTEEKKQ